MSDETEKVIPPEHRRFVEEYAYDNNATQAYRRVWPNVSYATARANAHRLLTYAHIQDELSHVREELSRRTGISARKVLRETAAIAFLDHADVFEEGWDGSPKPKKWNEIPPPARKAISSVKIKRKVIAGEEGQDSYILEEIEYRFHDKNKAIDTLCKRLGLTRTKAEQKLAETAAGSVLDGREPTPLAIIKEETPKDKPE